MTTSPKPSVFQDPDHTTEAVREYDEAFASREAIEAFREKIRDPEIDPGEARPEFTMRTQIEAALHHAGQHETGFYAFPYAPQDAYLDLALNLDTRPPLGALQTSGEHGPVRSVLAMALAGQDDLSTQLLLKRGAQLRDDEHPLRVLLSEGSPSSQAHGDHYDQPATKKCLEHLSDADIDINAPLDGEPPAFYAAYKLMSENLREDPLEPAGYRYNPITLRGCAVGGIDFLARDTHGRDVTEVTRIRLLADGHDPERVADKMRFVSDAVKITRSLNIHQKASQRLATHNAAKPARSDRDTSRDL